MKAFLLAAGMGERLKPITEKVPKPLVNVMGIPAICYSIMLLKEAGITDIVCNVHYKYEQVIDFLKSNDNFGLNIKFSIEDKILGTGGGLKRCEKHLKDSDFIIINSDIISDIYLQDIIKMYKSTSSPGLMSLYSVADTKKTAVVSVYDNHVVDFKNFLKTGIAPVFDYMGIAVLSPLIFQYLTEDFSSVVYTGFTDLIKHHSLGYYEHRGIWEDIGTVESLEIAEMNLVDNNTLKKRVTDQMFDIINKDS